MSVQAKLEFSSDPLSGPATTWVDISGKLRLASGGDGKKRELDQPSAATATFLLKDPERDLEPGYASGLLPEPLHRFRFSLNDGSGWTPWGLWYAKTYALQQPGGTTRYQEVQVECVDGVGLLGLSRLSLLNPPSATTYEEVALHLEPWGYWALSDAPSSTAAAAGAGPEGIVRAKVTRRRRRGRRLVPGPAGVVKSRSLLDFGVPGPVRGDRATAARFFRSGTTGGHIEIPLANQESLTDGGALTVAAWVQVPAGGGGAVVAGPLSGSLPIFSLRANPASGFGETSCMWNVNAGGFESGIIGPSLPTDQWKLLAGDFQNGKMTMLVDGVVEGVHSATITKLLTPTVGAPLRIGRDAGLVIPFDGRIGQVLIVERVLTAEEHEGLFRAGWLGFAAQASGTRVRSLADSLLWDETGMEFGGPVVAPIMEHGQPVLEEVLAAVKAELPTGMFFFDGVGNPVHLARDFQVADAYSTPQVILGGPPSIGEVGYSSVNWVYEHDVFTEVTTENEEGLAATASVSGPFALPHQETGLTLDGLGDLETAAAAIMELYREGRLRIDSVSLSSGKADQVTQLLARRIGEMVRIKHRGPGGIAIDSITHILGREWEYDASGADGYLSGSWSLARGFDATEQVWRLGVTGYSELGETTYLG